MSAASESRNDLARLLSALADGTLDDQGHEQLAAMLRSDPAARAKYYEYMQLAALLRREGRRTAAEGEEVETAPPIPVAKVSLPGKARRLRPWLIVLAASVLVALLLSVGEATGVTQFVPTMIRIVTGEGALVIEVDDPAVSVTLDGEDITITGAGIHELRLRPGTHKFIATKNGQPWREEVVTIERGGRQVVKVTREAAENSSLADPLAVELARRIADVERTPSDLKARFERGLAYARLNRLDEALADYSYVIESQPDRPEFSGAYMGRGEIRQGRGDWTGAIADFDRRAALVPHQGMATGRLALVYLFGPSEHRDPQKAAQYAEQAVRAEPNDHGYVTLHGIACYRLERLDEAIQTLERAATLPPGADSRDLYALALCYHAQGHAEKADAYYAKAVQAWDRTRSAQDATQLAFWQAFREEAEAMLANP